MIYRLDPNTISFPDPRRGEPNGLFAVGGDLSVRRLLLAYHHGIFPWYAYRKEDCFFCDEKGEPWIQWWCPMKRFVIFPDEIHISHSMRTLIRKRRYTFTFNHAFEQVIHQCGALRDQQQGAWLGPDMEEAYTKLHRLGWASSVEVWDNANVDNAQDSPRLVGGLYGVTIGKCFIGESMFSLVPNASKLALIFLAGYMKEHQLTMIDCQLRTPHLESMGGRYISYDKYMSLLNPNTTADADN